MDGQTAILPLWKEALKNFIATGPKPGDVVRRDWLMEQFGIEKPVTAEEQQAAQLHFLQEFLEFKNALLVEYRIDLRSVFGVGFEVIPPSEQTRHAIETGTKRIGREIGRMARSIIYTNTAALNEAEMKERTDGLAKVSAMQSMFSRRKLLGRG